jgi:hypothetical protein
MIPIIIIYLLGVIATVILLIFIFIAVKYDKITLLDLALGIIISLTSWFGFMLIGFIGLIRYGEVVIYERKKK